MRFMKKTPVYVFTYIFYDETSECAAKKKKKKIVDLAGVVENAATEERKTFLLSSFRATSFKFSPTGVMRKKIKEMKTDDAKT